MILLVFTLVLLCCNAILVERLVGDQWKSYMLQYNKIYKSETEEQYRQNVFVDNLYQIKEHNKLYEMGLSTYKRGINKFSDLLNLEFLQMYTILANLTEFESDNQEVLFHEQEQKVTYTPIYEESIDWRLKGVVTPVKDQGKLFCNAGWAFGTTGALEAHWKIKTGNLVSLSEQNLLDCSRNYGNSCKGGSFSRALQYVILNDGIDTESSYPYGGRELRCRFKEENVGAKARNYIQVRRGNESDLQNVIQNIGPVAVAIDASQPDFQNPTSGIYDNPHCSQTKPTHTVLVVGYGSEKGHDYWLVKNSWGKTWGENGYIRMSRNKDNQCGIANSAYYPIVEWD